MFGPLVGCWLLGFESCFACFGVLASIVGVFWCDSKAQIWLRLSLACFNQNICNQEIYTYLNLLKHLVGPFCHVTVSKKDVFFPLHALLTCWLCVHVGGGPGLSWGQEQKLSGICSSLDIYLPKEIMIKAQQQYHKTTLPKTNNNNNNHKTIFHCENKKPLAKNYALCKISL